MTAIPLPLPRFGMVGMAERYVIAVLTNPAKGREAEFNDWYDNQHIPDVLAIPGVLSARRYELAHAQRMEAPWPYGYFAFYEVETDDLPALVDDMRQRGGTASMPMSDALDPQRLTLFFAPLGDARRSAPNV